MAIIDDRTAGRNYALPNAANKLKDDVIRVRAALAGIDTDVVAILLELAGKADSDHAHSISEITGLVAALNGKIGVGYHDALDDLSDVSVTGATNGQVLIKQGSTWIPIALQVGNITNLETLLNAKATPADITAAINGIVGAAPGALDTLIELATALGNDPNFATTITNALALKAPLASPPLTGTPTAPTAAVGTNTAQIATTAFVGTAIAPLSSKIDTRRNLIVNGSMAVSQENGNTLGTTNGYYPADQFALYFTAPSSAMSVQRIQARTLANALDQIEFKTTTAKASLAAGDSVTLTQNIEGSAFADAGFGTANAKPLVLRAQVQLPAGLYHFHLQNSAGNRHCAVPFTIASGEANTAVVKEIVVPADTSGTWPTGDGVIGMTGDLVLAAGSGKTGGSASTWGATAYLAASTQFNTLSSTSNVARLADVGLKLDLDATGVYGAYRANETDAVYRSERYWEKSYNAGVSLGAVTQEGMEAVRTGASLAWRVSHKFLKAKTPTITLYNPRTGATAAWDDISGSSSFTASTNYVGQSGFTVIIPSPVSTNLYGGHWSANARLS